MARSSQALPSKCAEGVTKFVLSLITRFGCFKVCISDQGREFVNSLNEKLFSLTGIEHRTCIASAYHPQTNGLDERLNQTVTKFLVKYINTDQNDWDEKLEYVLFSYRTSIHATVKSCSKVKKCAIHQYIVYYWHAYNQCACTIIN